jgi:hypothetical protein
MEINPKLDGSITLDNMVLRLRKRCEIAAGRLFSCIYPVKPTIFFKGRDNYLHVGTIYNED